ncbi:MAG: peptidylprolyl isomerase [Planctomycetota bacterium]
MQIAKHTVASIDYTLSDDAGNVIDSSKDRGPLTYVHGVGGLIPGLEKELDGKATGDSLKVRVEPAEGYGERNDAMVQDVPRAQLPEGVDVQVGMQLQAQTPNGPHIVTVVGVTEDAVKLDGNHPLAGVALNFDVKIVEVRAATAEEIEHGHVHGAGGPPQG